MKTETVAIESISEDPANLRRHPDRNLGAIMASLRRFGQQKPIVVDRRGIVIAGNGTLAAARKLGWSEIAIVRTKLASHEAISYAIADNRTAELAEWEDESLAKVLSDLATQDEDLLEAAGFTQDELDKMVAEVTGVDDDGAVGGVLTS